jgi:hypothetical protein
MFVLTKGGGEEIRVGLNAENCLRAMARKAAVTRQSGTREHVGFMLARLISLRLEPQLSLPLKQ